MTSRKRTALAAESDDGDDDWGRGALVVTVASQKVHCAVTEWKELYPVYELAETD